MNIKLEEIIKNRDIRIVLQPIVDFNGPAIIGYEALARGPVNTKFKNPKILFEDAKKNGLTIELEFLCIVLAIEKFEKDGLTGRLFLNVSPISLTERSLPEYLKEVFENKIKLNREQIVIELSEQHPYDNYQEIGNALKELKENKFEIAIDDLGAGFSSLRIWSEFKPEFVKVDIHFIRNININRINYEFVRCLHEISRTLGCSIIAEGIETEKELRTICGIGISHGQGYLLGKPASEAQLSISKKTIKFIRPLRQFHFSKHNENLSKYVETISPLRTDNTLEEAAKIFEKIKTETVLPVIDEKSQPAGVLTKNKLFETFYTRYGRELFSNKNIHNFIDHDVFSVDISLSLSEVSTIYTTKNEIDMNHNIIVTNNDNYVGVLRTKTLLSKITEQKVLSARYANPLTMLPGNVPIYEWIDFLLTKKESFKVAYFDLNHFKPYNDIYGYANGDRIIILLSNILKQVIDPDRDRLGHIGGDDFVIIFQTEDWLLKCNRVFRIFDERVLRFYTKEDLKNKGINSFDRRGNKEFFSLLNLSVGIVEPDPSLCKSHNEVAELASDAKKQAKMMGPNSIFFSKRRGPTLGTNEIAVEESKVK